jgi:hypothetical protein
MSTILHHPRLLLRRSFSPIVPSTHFGSLHNHRKLVFFSRSTPPRRHRSYVCVYITHTRIFCPAGEEEKEDLIKKYGGIEAAGLWAGLGAAPACVDMISAMVGRFSRNESQLRPATAQRDIIPGVGASERERRVCVYTCLVY